MRTFAGIPNEYASYSASSVVLLPVPYDGTSTYGKGADKGPEAFFSAAENMELYDIETQSEVYKKGVYLAPPVLEISSPEAMVQAVALQTEEILSSGKFFSMIGGEHSVSIGAMRAFRKKYRNLSVLQLDAHSDLRPVYEGSACNHACAMHEVSKHCPLVQVGIRSMDAVELPFIVEERLFTTYKMRQQPSWMHQALAQLTDTVYLTIDLDAFDPAIMPSTGTPEPGGLLWNDTLDFLKEVFRKKNVVGFDIVELAPKEGQHAPDFLAAKLYYKLLSYKYHLNG